MRSLPVLAIFAACAAPPHAPPTSPASPASPTTPTAADPEPAHSHAPETTAGLYWVPYTTCDDCEAPAALVAYVTPDETTARSILHALDGTLALGLPYAIHTDDLATAGSAIAIVTGSYSVTAAATAALAHLAPIAGVAPAVIDLGSLPRDQIAAESHHVVVIDRGSAVPAWSTADVEAIFAGSDDADGADGSDDEPSTHGSFHVHLMRSLRTRRPACMVQPGDLFVAGPDDHVQWYDLAPVRCNGQVAYVEWTSTLLGHAVIVRDDSRDGVRATLSQVVGAECDMPFIESWVYDRNGRHAELGVHRDD